MNRILDNAFADLACRIGEAANECETSEDFTALLSEVNAKTHQLLGLIETTKETWKYIQKES